jgi:NAD(P)-dependent dehydrogenase (short-subunit alcohol dehydrogenase family)
MAVALITGTSTGIGLETARVFARRGYRVFAGARSPASSQGLSRASDEGLPISPIVLDVDSDESVRKAVEKTGPVDVLVNNAGIGSAAPVEHMPMQEIQALFETNFFGAVRMMQAFLPSMRERRSGTVVNVTSIMGRITLPCHGYYAATKFALEAVSESLAMEMQPFGVRVAIIEPGVILTPIWGKRQPAMPAAHEYRPALERLRSTLGAQMDGGTLPDVVADAIYATVTNQASPLHVPVGEDAELMAAVRDRTTADEWISLFAEPDKARFVARAAEMFGVDMMSPPSLHARHAGRRAP